MNEEYFFANNLKYLRRKYNIEQQELAEELGRKSGSTVSDWERGKFVPRIGTLSQIAERFNISVNDLMRTDLTVHTPIAPNMIEVSEMVKIPVLGTIACGEPIDAIENVSEYRLMPKDMKPSGELFYLEAQGDSMEPKIYNGSFVLCRKQEDVESGEIAAVLVNGDEQTTLKKVIKQGDTIFLQALNEAYAPYIITKENPARIVGKALRVENEL
ncbi:hypothetical protein MPS01_13640 [Marinilactibacillus psychrotolerans]|uniref:Peptidase S24-like protein n=2 Tax=Marinilactibacillus psychrotolerans TaxID=191770 RepID=A0AAV3WV20_9LACT|nr:hypothetical protein MPS01_13640 [Marinilactibacillus psychrotolerans]GEQ36013.1 peptidase S24-like protein [Marinilactibacillus psychrotolerans]SDC59718.1 repressor LexA [Marinilactibacillus psychrotolerans]